MEQGPLIADGNNAEVRAGRWPLDTGSSRALDGVIRKVSEGQEQGDAKAGMLSGCRVHQKTPGAL